MKTGKTLSELAAEIERLAEAKHDFVTDTRTMSVVTEVVDDVPVGTVLMADEGGRDGGLGSWTISDYAHSQIRERLAIPAVYYERLRHGDGRKRPAFPAMPELLDETINRHFRERPERRMVRTFDTFPGVARAFLSDRYRRLDNEDFAEAVLPILQELPEVRIVSAEITERKLYIKAVFPRIQADVKVGDTVQAGVVLSNSEIGAGALSVWPLVYRLVCNNGMIAEDFGVSRHHVGRRVEESEQTYRFFRDETLRADDEALWMKVADLVRGAATEARFQMIVERLRETTTRRIEGDPVGATERLAKRHDLSDTERGSVLRHLAEGGDLSQWGLVNAITRASQDVESYDRATELEALGGIVARAEGREWATLAVAA